MSLLSTLPVVILSVFYYVTVLFIISLFVKRNDIADSGWGIGILIVSYVSYQEQFAPTLTSTIILSFIAIWAVRLSVRILKRNLKKTEDERYRVWRESWGKWFYLRSFFQVYLLQGTLMMLVGYSAIHISVYGLRAIELPWLYIGSALWCIGFIFETVSDYQLDTFLQNNQNKGLLMTSGLWKYSRHPNYFGEVLMWWGIFCIVAPFPFGFWALISPLTITFLILKVSGIPMLEKNMSEHPQFEEYKNRTSIFIPLPPKNKAL